MAKYFSFSYKKKKKNRSVTVSVIFSPDAFSLVDLNEEIRRMTDRMLPPDMLFLISPKDSVCPELNDLVDGEDVFLPIQGKTHVVNVGFGLNGGIEKISDVRSGECAQIIDVDEGLLKDIRRRGLTDIFRKRNGYLDAGEGAYFLNQKTGGAEKKAAGRVFLRASNALSDSAEVWFFAFCLLGFFSKSLEVVYIDTSTISSVVYAVFALKRINRIIDVENFYSYNGLLECEFSAHKDSLVIVSASQSGEMASFIRDNRIRNVVTLFQLSEHDDDNNIVLCNLKRCPDNNPEGFCFRPFFSDSQLSGLRALKIVSDQFLVEANPQFSIVPAERYLPKNKRELEFFYGKGIFICNKTDVGSEKSRAIWVDSEVLVEGERFKSWLSSQLLMYASFLTGAVVYLSSDKGSEKAAKFVFEALKPVVGGEISLLSSDCISQKENGLGDKACCVVVVGGAIGHGRRFLEVSQALRDWAPKSHRVFLSGMVVAERKSEIDLLKSNLCYPRHIFKSMLEVCVKRNHDSHSWDQELAFWEEVFSIQSDVVVDFDVEERIDDLKKTSRGLSDNLFLKSNLGKILTIRDNFAFVDNSKVDHCQFSQADIFFIVSTLLQNMRVGENMEADGVLFSDSFHHRVLSPITFARFNDGVIQASFLRAAYPVELDYRSDPSNSRLMGDIIIDCISSRDKKKGEASAEIMLALVLGNMKISDLDKRRVLGVCSSGSNSNLTEFLLSRY